MAKVGIISSAGAGFSLIATRPAAVLVWAVIYLLLGAAPYIVPMILAGPEYFQFLRDAFSNPTLASNPPPAVAAIDRYQGLQLLGTLAAMTLTYTAMQRAVIFPDQKSWFSMRVSWAELRTAALIVILYILFTLILVVTMVVVLVPVAIAVGVAGGGAEGMAQVVLVGFLALLGALLALAYPGARLAMAIPMSVGEDRFRLFEAWKFTRGYGWQLVVIYLVVVLTTVLIQVIFLAVMAAGAIGVIGGLDRATLREFFGRPDWIKDATGWFVAVFLGWFAIAAISTPIMVAPWAEAYRRIAGVKTQDAHSVFD